MNQHQNSTSKVHSISQNCNAIYYVITFTGSQYIKNIYFITILYMQNKKAQIFLWWLKGITGATYYFIPLCNWLKRDNVSCQHLMIRCKNCHVHYSSPSLTYHIQQPHMTCCSHICWLEDQQSWQAWKNKHHRSRPSACSRDCWSDNIKHSLSSYMSNCLPLIGLLDNQEISENLSVIRSFRNQFKC